MAKDLKCPNCGAAVVRKDDGSCVCTDKECGGTFTFKEGEARLTGVGEYDQLKGKVEKLEADQADLRELLGKPDAPADDSEDPLPPAGPDPGHVGDEDDGDDEEDW